jgi:TatD DNase family protein
MSQVSNVSNVSNLKSQISYVDTHCHIHDSEFAAKSELTQEQIIARAKEAGVDKLICVGTSLKSSVEAAKFVKNHEGCYYSIALHPHEAENYSIKELEKHVSELDVLGKANPHNFVAIGECGLDYFYHSNKKVINKQKMLLRLHLDLAVRHKKPVIFHVRGSDKIDLDGEMSDAFLDFFTIIDEYAGIKGVIHSFSASETELEEIIKRDFYVGLNGIMTFTKDQKQLNAAKKVPIDKLVVETDAPFLTPKPFRGKMNEPKHVINITQFLSELRGESQAFLAKQTTKNAKKLFKL